MKKNLNYQNAISMIRGSSIYSTGGGFAYSGQKRMFNNLFKKVNSIKLISIDELKDNDYICTAYAVGSAGNTDIDLSPALRQGLQVLQNFTGIKPKAIFAGETNIDIIASQSAVALNLPILDADSNGGRAVPEIQMDNFVIYDKPITPVVVVTLDGDVAILQQTKNPYNIENFVRSIAGNSKIGMVAVLDHLIQVKLAKKILTHGIFSRSLKLGQLIQENYNNQDLLEKIIREINGQLLIKGKVFKSTLKSNLKEGFLNGDYFIKDRKGNVVKVYAKNENIICWKNNRVFATSPDRILTIDTKTFLGIHNSQLKEDEEVAVIVAKASEMWRSKKALELFEPRHFGFLFKPKLLK